MLLPGVNGRTGSDPFFILQCLSYTPSVYTSKAASIAEDFGSCYNVNNFTQCFISLHSYRDGRGTLSFTGVIVC